MSDKKTGHRYNLLNLLACCLIAATVAGCSGSNVATMFQTNESPAGPEPSRPDIGINILVKPAMPWPLNEKKALLVPVQMANSRENRWEAALTGIAHSVLLQERLFAVVECYEKDSVPLSTILKEAEERGFDYIITCTVPNILVPSGNSAGWVGLSLKIRGAKPGSYTIWNLYGGSDLTPEPTRHDLLGTSTAVNAPSVTTGFFALVKSMARIIKEG